ncbi:MAG: hypothetical protein K1X51_18230 [Rhodospirillaceae bacterium]|nr:hypothetical protein [Rhodospirillaceae bacterium]
MKVALYPSLYPKGVWEAHTDQDGDSDREEEDCEAAANSSCEPTAGRWRFSGWSLRGEAKVSIDTGYPDDPTTVLRAKFQPAVGGTLVQCRSYAPESEHLDLFSTAILVAMALGSLLYAHFQSGGLVSDDHGGVIPIWKLMWIPIGIGLFGLFLHQSRGHRARDHHEILATFVARATEAMRDETKAPPAGLFERRD